MPGAQGEAGGRCEIGAHRSVADDAGLPADTRTDQKAALRRVELQYLGEFGLQALSRPQCRHVEQLRKRSSFQRQDAEFRQNLLLPHPQPQSLRRQIRRRRPAFGRFGHEFGGFRMKRHDAVGHEPTFEARRWTRSARGYGTRWHDATQFLTLVVQRAESKANRHTATRARSPTESRLRGPRPATSLLLRPDHRV